MSSYSDLSGVPSSSGSPGCWCDDMGTFLAISATGVGAQSTLGVGKDIFARKYMYEKLTKCPNFTWQLPKKYFCGSLRARAFLPPRKPAESHSGARETVLTGPYHNLHMCRDRDAKDVEREETRGGVMSPHHSSRGLGSVVSSPSGVGFYAYSSSERSHSRLCSSCIICRNVTNRLLI